jgi:mannosylfructose-phosphate synthase
MSKGKGRIAMLSTHGYFDPVPVLGQTDTGGQVVYVLELAKALSQLGWYVDIYTRWFDQGKKQVELVPQFPDVRVIRIQAGPWDFTPKEEIYKFLPQLSANMIKFIEQENLIYSLFHGHYIDAGIVTLDVARHFDKPSFFTAHSLGAWKREQMGGDPGEMEIKFKFNHRVSEENRILNSVAANSVTSDLQLEKLHQLYNYKETNVDVIPPGVDIHRFKSPDRKDKPANGNLPERYIYCLSRIDTNKGHDMLLKAFYKVSQRIPEVKLIIGGGSPKPKPREQQVFKMMDQVIDDLGIRDSLVFVGYVPDDLMASYYQHASLFVMPSLFEPFGMTTQEAMACGTPVIASKYGGIRTVIENEKNGILVDPKDADEFAEAMIRLITDPEWNSKIGRAGQKFIREHYSWEVIAKRHLKFYSRYSMLTIHD